MFCLGVVSPTGKTYPPNSEMVVYCVVLMEILLSVTVQSELVPIYPQCNRVAVVDKTINRCENSTLQIPQVSCPSLKDVFLLLRNSSSARSLERDNCTEISLKGGDHTVEGSVIGKNENIFLHSSGAGRVKVRLTSSVQPTSLSFCGAEFVAIDGIDFISFDSGTVSFDKVTYAQITNSSFR